MNLNMHAACELLIQEMGENLPLGNTPAECLAQVNILRIARQWPMVTSMSCFNPSIMPATFSPLDLDLKPLRAYWDKGLTLVLKHDRHDGVAQMLACCKPLAELPGNHILSEMARILSQLLPLLGLNDVDIMIELAGRFDKFLRDASHLDLVLTENFIRDALFYLSLKNPEEFVQAWEWNDEGFLGLQLRLKWHAKQLAHLLYPTEDTDKIDKTVIEKSLLPVTDGLLFLNEITLRTRLLLRMEKIDTRMLKIAVPVQLLMGEAIRLA